MRTLKVLFVVFILLFSAHVPAQSVEQPQQKPIVNARAYLVIDRNTNETLLEHNADAPLPIASLTKLMTAVVALDHATPTETLRVPDYIEGIEPTIMGLSAGEELAVEKLLAGLLLPSGNDAAETLAWGIGGKLGGRDAFIAAMNEKAESLGLTNTRFRNPTGFDLPFVTSAKAGVDGHVSSARDLSKLTEYALSTYPILQELVATQKTAIAQTSTHKSFRLVNGNVLLNSPGFTGVKIGNTPQAGECAIITYSDGDRNLLIILLGSNQRERDILQILNDQNIFAI